VNKVTLTLNIELHTAPGSLHQPKGGDRHQNQKTILWSTGGNRTTLDNAIKYRRPLKPIKAATGGDCVRPHVRKVHPITQFQGWKTYIFRNNVNTVARGTKEGAVVQDNIEWRFPQGSTDWSCVIVDNIIEISVNTIRTIILSLIDLENLFGFGVEFTGEVVSLCINLESYGRGTSTKKNGQVRL